MAVSQHRRPVSTTDLTIVIVLEADTVFQMRWPVSAERLDLAGSMPTAVIYTAQYMPLNKPSAGVLRCDVVSPLGFASPHDIASSTRADSAALEKTQSFAFQSL